MSVEFHVNLVMARLQAGLSQKQLAELSGLSTGHLSKIEKGKLIPKESTQKRLLDCIESKLNSNSSLMSSVETPSISVENIGDAVNELRLLKDEQRQSTVVMKDIRNGLSENIVLNHAHNELLTKIERYTAKIIHATEKLHNQDIKIRDLESVIDDIIELVKRKNEDASYSSNTFAFDVEFRLDAHAKKRKPRK
jgi:transcriptional regulator with XRE-family HTH domain